MGKFPAFVVVGTIASFPPGPPLPPLRIFWIFSVIFQKSCDVRRNCTRRQVQAGQLLLCRCPIHLPATKPIRDILLDCIFLQAQFELAFLSTIQRVLPPLINKNINIRNTTTMAANGTTETTSLVHKSKEDEENFAKLKAYQP